MIATVLKNDEPVVRGEHRQVAERRHQQRAARRIEIVRVDVVEVLVVDVPAAPEVRHRAVHRAEVVGDVAVGGQHIAAVDDRHDRERPQRRTQHRCRAGRAGAGPKAFSRPDGQESARGRHRRATVHRQDATADSGGAVRVGRRQLAAVEVADHGRQRTRRVDAGAVSDALPHHPLAGGAGVDDGGRRRGATPSLPTIGSFCTPSSSTLILRFFGSLGAAPLGQFRHFTRFERPDRAELRVQLAPGDHEFAHPVGGRPVQRVAAGVDELAVGCRASSRPG